MSFFPIVLNVLCKVLLDIQGKILNVNMVNVCVLAAFVFLVVWRADCVLNNLDVPIVVATHCHHPLGCLRWIVTESQGLGPPTIAPTVSSSTCWLRTFSRFSLNILRLDSMDSSSSRMLSRISSIASGTSLSPAPPSNASQRLLERRRTDCRTAVLSPPTPSSVLFVPRSLRDGYVSLSGHHWAR